MMQRIIFEDDMKIHQMFADDVYHYGAEYRLFPERSGEDEHDRNEVPGYLVPEFGTPTLNGLFHTWWKHTPHRGRPASVQEIQHRLREIAGLNKPQYTPRQTHHRSMGADIHLIFSRVRRISHLGFRNFMWRFFQGALPFNHRKECDLCEEKVKLNHKHIFFECEQNTPVWRDHKLWSNLTKAVDGDIGNPPTSELTLWYLWGKKSSTEAQRICSGVALWTIWRSRAKDVKPIPYVNLLEQVIQDWLASYGLIKNANDRCVKRAKMEARLAIRSALWSMDGSMPYISRLAKKFMQKPRPRTINVIIAKTKRMPNF